MALINCSECGKEISDKAQSCPNCGTPISAAETTPLAEPSSQAPKKSGKWKYILLGVVVLAVFGSIIEKIDDKGPSETSRIAKSPVDASKPKQLKSDDDPCKNIKTMDDWNRASTLFQMKYSQCNPGGKGEAKKQEQKEKDLEAGISTMRDALTKSIRSTVKASRDFGDYDLQVEVGRNSYSAILIYPKDLMPMEAAQIISKAAVLAILKALIAQGIDPAKEWSEVHANVYTRLKGVTGKDMVREYGMASYDYNSDEIVWRR